MLIGEVPVRGSHGLDLSLFLFLTHSAGLFVCLSVHLSLVSCIQ